MIVAIIAFFVVILSLNAFMISYQVNGINRLVYGIPMSIFETAIELYQVNETVGPHFNKDILADNLYSYFSYHMPRYSPNYYVHHHYYNIADHTLDMNDKLQAVEVTLYTSLIMNFPYQKTMCYEIRSN